MNNYRRKFVVTVRRVRHSVEGPQFGRWYVRELHHGPDLGANPIGTRMHFAAHQWLAFKFRTRSAAEVVAAIVGGDVVRLRRKVAAAARSSASDDGLGGA